jgi:hypothetical protein
MHEGLAPLDWYLQHLLDVATTTKGNPTSRPLHLESSTRSRSSPSQIRSGIKQPGQGPPWKRSNTGSIPKSPKNDAYCQESFRSKLSTDPASWLPPSATDPGSTPPSCSSRRRTLAVPPLFACPWPWCLTWHLLGWAQSSTP